MKKKGTIAIEARRKQNVDSLNVPLSKQLTGLRAHVNLLS